MSDFDTPLEIHWSARARNDLIKISDYIARDSPAAAQRWTGLLMKDVTKAALFPLAGRRVPEITNRDNIREILRRTYRTVYLVKEDAIIVLTIFEGHHLFPDDALQSPEQRSLHVP